MAAILLDFSYAIMIDPDIRVVYTWFLPNFWVTDVIYRVEITSNGHMRSLKVNVNLFKVF